MTNSVHGKKLFLVLVRGLSQDRYFLTCSLCDLSLFTTDTDIANYAGDIHRVYENKTCKVIERLGECSGDMFTWFEIDGTKVENDRMKANPEKCHLVSKEKPSTSVISDKLKN